MTRSVEGATFAIRYDNSLTFIVPTTRCNVGAKSRLADPRGVTRETVRAIRKMRVVGSQLPVCVSSRYPLPDSVGSDRRPARIRRERASRRSAVSCYQWLPFARQRVQ
jgi:hypothetical protein